MDGWMDRQIYGQAFTMCQTVHWVFCSQQHCEVDAIIISNLQMGKLRCGEGNTLCHDLKLLEQQSLELKLKVVKLQSS